MQNLIRMISKTEKASRAETEPLEDLVKTMSKAENGLNEVPSDLSQMQGPSSPAQGDRPSTQKITSLEI